MTHPLRDTCNVAIIGSGPAGLATANTLQDAGHDCLIFEAGCLAQNLMRFPTHMEFFSTANLIELRGFPLVCPRGNPTRREYLAYLARYARDRHLKVRLHEPVEMIEAADEGFVVHSRRPADGATCRTRARRVVIAIGAYAQPAPLGCPGEELDKVSHYYTEAHPYVGSRVLVVGNGNSAVEAALELCAASVEVTMAVRSEGFGHVKYWIQPAIENRIREGIVPAHFSTAVEAIGRESVTLRPADGEPFDIGNDFVLALTGYEPDVTLLRRCGVEVDDATKRPHYDPETLETNVPGLFVAGVIAAGNISAEIFIENSRYHGEKILKGISG